MNQHNHQSKSLELDPSGCVPGPQSEVTSTQNWKLLSIQVVGNASEAITVSLYSVNMLW